LLGKMTAEEREPALAAQRESKASLKELEHSEQELRAVVQDIAMRLPMPPAADVPDGKDDTDNVEMTTFSKPTEFDFEVLSHDELAEQMGLLDIKRGVKIAGSRNYLLLGDLARLERAVLNYAIDHMLAREFELVSVPTLVNRACMEGTGYFPGGEEQAYLAERDDLALIGTSEVPLTSIHSGEVLNTSVLPLRRVALSPCYRREAGTYGKDTKGLYRVHQFWKVEQVVLGPNDLDWSLEEHKRMLGHATDLMQALELPYRVVNVCTGDLGQGQVQKFDIETWMPSRGNYGETHSASRFHDFQTRRLNLRYKSGKDKPQFCHSLNNTVIASPRVLIALLENHQNADGSVNIPQVLQPYMGGQQTIS
jgi:seryl-tRNA synthetase